MTMHLFESCVMHIMKLSHPNPIPPSNHRAAKGAQNSTPAMWATYNSDL